jgi:hypothetical protein
LESIADINNRLGNTGTFGATAQGRSIGISAIVALSATRFLVLERDNRGMGIDNVANEASGRPGSKRVYLIDISGATDVANISLAGTNSLPGSVTPVSKTLFFDIQVIT